MIDEYYFISDLHIGGDAELDICDFEPELIKFLQELERKKNAELIIVGDLFGFWELTKGDGIEKLKIIVENHRELFEQFRKTGEKIVITVIPGNHDYPLACTPDFIKVLAGYNICLEPYDHIIREVAGKKIWIEHGSQHDSFNRALKYGDPYVTPIGYYITSHITSIAGRHSEFGRGQWLRDLESVQPYEHIPDWLLSNYFYREMSPILRWIFLPFLLLFSVSLVAFIGMILEQEAILGTNIFNRQFLSSLGLFGKLFGLIVMVDFVIIIILILISIPVGFILHDILRTLRRYGLKQGVNINVQKTDVYKEAARRVFARDPTVGIFLFGHTHSPFLERVGDKVIINTGTWLKRLIRVRAWGKLLPDIYYPTFCLNYFRIFEDEGRIMVNYQQIYRRTASNLTALQKIMMLGKKPETANSIPDRTVLPGLINRASG